ncbi:isopentenyl-diphosphate delta-isomerase idi1 [Coemansia sp. RSA 455]|nr:isopentenyl-diphosphate delta-isomerase idi1 [Coemansia sp. S680]KAJ2040362.1 isopentenyl-diphosphate delta-isomerase idi1 [Coemansia sp. S3946]KAJ2049433.1 isopentenyl-diphosphate delta-isomerase idi1 [Coemansia sp. S16]KAJ2069837.1 isopentenyl-diphosphate delta-isomerase idi1 [Coemansia sp. S2]KAJ2075391.1 isopentenyl-diphosphate delta-isomerase idi1 [Coemansia sp. S155-1]KAJ2095894.1 isopentenyl-diphosphate delta-isomerase idi1 [Coemansia sp. S100]KAJ2253082.1 isopentenyl-diphosphate de
MLQQDTSVDFSGYDEEQVRLMEEMCILVDENDKAIGPASKKTCHLMENINTGMLHRAFSVFLFNSRNELLLQQRASEKITFPDCYTNTCCSHPLYVPGELDEVNQMGVKRAAQRKLEHELGIKPEQVPLDKFQYLTRIHYVSPSDGQWGEHEIDYILFIKADVDLDVNENEVGSVKYVSKEEMMEIIETAEETGTKLTPWFKLIDTNFLYKWWDQLDDLSACVDTETIHRLL